MYKVFLLLSVLIVSGCNSDKSVFVSPVYVSPEYVEQETLIKVYDRTATGGEMCFLTKKDEIYEYWEFFYGTDPKQKKAFCKLTDRKIYQMGDEDIPNYSWWETANGLATNNNYRGKSYNKEREKSLNCLADNFLQLTNDQKLDVMKKYSRESGFSHGSWERRITWLDKSLVDDVCLDDTCQIIDWRLGEYDQLTLMKEYVVDGKHLLVFIVESGFGIIRSDIYIFKRENRKWTLAAEGLVSNQQFHYITTETSPDNRQIVFKGWNTDYNNTDISRETKEIVCGDNKKIKYTKLKRQAKIPSQITALMIIGGLNIDDL